MSATLRSLGLALLAAGVLAAVALLWWRWGAQVFVAGLGAGLC
jgi:hypothetical protein